MKQGDFEIGCKDEMVDLRVFKGGDKMKKLELIEKINRIDLKQWLFTSNFERSFRTRE